MLTLYWNWVFLIKIFFSANSAHYCTTCLNHCSLFLVLPKPACSWSQGNFLFEPSGSASHLSQWAPAHTDSAETSKSENFNRPLQLSKINLSSWLFCYLNKDDGNLLFKQFLSCTKTWNLVWSLMILINKALNILLLNCKVIRPQF